MACGSRVTINTAELLRYGLGLPADAGPRRKRPPLRALLAHATSGLGFNCAREDGALQAGWGRYLAPKRTTRR